MRTRGRALIPLLALSFLMAIAAGDSSFADTPPQPKGAQEAKPQPNQPAPAAPGKAKTNAARKAAEARMARCRLHPEICVQ
jgi:hypothetical protein